MLSFKVTIDKDTLQIKTQATIKHTHDTNEELESIGSLDDLQNALGMVTLTEELMPEMHQARARLQQNVGRMLRVRR